MTAAIEWKKIDGKPAFRLASWPKGVWKTSRSPLDAMMDLMTRTLEEKRMTIYHAIGVDPAAASRYRKGAMAMPDGWLLRMSDYSGIPVSELRRIGGVESTVIPHPKAANAAAPG